MSIKIRSFFLTVAFIFAVGLFSGNTVMAQDKGVEAALKGEKIGVRVDGLSCAFCAFSLEKKLKEIKNVESADINVTDGVVYLILKKGTSVTEEQIKEKVDESGFTFNGILKGS